MGELVEAVNSLCKIVNCLISTSLKPEFIRLSKINNAKKEEIQQFWEIIHKLCCFTTMEFCQNDAVKCVQNFLHKQGSIMAYNVSQDATPRQLLLCFGWLLARGTVEAIIDKIIKATPLANEQPQLMSDEPGDIGRFRSSTNLPVGIRSTQSENNLVEMKNHEKFLVGLIQHNMRAISNYRQERVQFITKLHKMTAGIHGLPQLSVGDTYLLSHPDQIPQFIDMCKHILPILQAYSRWNTKSKVFWMWMKSVLKEEESSQFLEPHSEEMRHIFDFCKRLENNVRKEVRQIENDFEVAEEEFDCLTTNRMQLCDSSNTADNIIKDLDGKILKLTKANRKKSEELKTKLSAANLNSEQIDVINSFVKNLKLL